uniref:Glycosyltransferase 2-like domain-containing protein n=1 Tax=Chromera velia CCMP2878 TaxID=1169474 RepID=A0A0G4ICM8_9ALVE|eukprot:Cvel_2268.t1-p1 / transcript=Cvel_2268.t1 / gene=Cvel_2268 / organism=Chromera_velia_CCMP2878 / gene_product=Beta-1,4-mannosyltransferase egh, putative / transcript_product=Beta-1,4-mannosyltransferase egh, putative / location=Cvel_scaffold87:128561-131302(+) / protein_length=914 / sequence_SO=supercontig / SO=protein_coding / is_pseudo=false
MIFIDDHRPDKLPLLPCYSLEEVQVSRDGRDDYVRPRGHTEGGVKHWFGSIPYHFHFGSYLLGVIGLVVTMLVTFFWNGQGPYCLKYGCPIVTPLTLHQTWASPDWQSRLEGVWFFVVWFYFMPPLISGWLLYVCGFLNLAGLTPSKSATRHQVIKAFTIPPQETGGPLRHRHIHFRVVTKGRNPDLIQHTLEHNLNTVRPFIAEGLLFSPVVEIVTDHALPNIHTLEETGRAVGVTVREILVPPSYTCPQGSLYKARALHYANVVTLGLEEGGEGVNGESLENTGGRDSLHDQLEDGLFFGRGEGNGESRETHAAACNGDTPPVSNRKMSPGGLRKNLEGSREAERGGGGMDATQTERVVSCAASLSVTGRESEGGRGGIVDGGGILSSLRGSVTDDDLIVHLDEETKLTPQALQGLLSFYAERHIQYLDGAVRREEEIRQTPAWFLGKNAQRGVRRSVEDVTRGFDAIAQGIIVYGQERPVGSLAATLADSTRVLDDFTRFRLFFSLVGAPLQGMKGSFIAVPARYERNPRSEGDIDVAGCTFDVGPRSSITEDAAWALRLVERGVRIGFIRGILLEKSPFSFRDFVKQRGRWIQGLWKVALDSDGLKLSTRLPLLIAVSLYSLVPVNLILGHAFALYTFGTGTLGTLTWTGVFFQTTMQAMALWGYSFGAFHNLRPRNAETRVGRLCMQAEKVFLCILCGALVDVWLLMEAAGTLYAFSTWRTTSQGFHIVEKDFAGQTGSNNVLAAPPHEPKCQKQEQKNNRVWQPSAGEGRGDGAVRCSRGKREGSETSSAVSEAGRRETLPAAFAGGVPGFFENESLDVQGEGEVDGTQKVERKDQRDSQEMEKDGKTGVNGDSGSPTGLPSLQQRCSQPSSRSTSDAGLSSRPRTFRLAAVAEGEGPNVGGACFGQP